MTAVIVIYVLLFLIQRTVSYFMSDYPNINITLQQILGVFLPVFAYYKLKGEKYISKSDLKIISPSAICFSAFAGMFMQISCSLLNFFPIVFLDSWSIPVPKSVEIPEGMGILGYIFAVCLLPAITEEVLFRKFTYGKLSKYANKVTPILVAVIFGISHFDLYSFVPLTVVGLILSCIVKEKFPLIYAMTFHFAFNISGVLLQKLTAIEHINEILNNYFIPLGIITSVFEVIFVIYLVRYSKVKGRKE